MIKADPFAQVKLLDLQQRDSRVIQLRRERSQLPQLAALAEIESTRTGVQDVVRDAGIEVEDLSRDQRKADADVEQVKARRERDQGRIDANQVGAKDLERLQSELVSLARRISDLEDVELEIMERLESAQQRLRDAQARLAELDARHAEISAERDEAWARIDEQLREAGQERDELAADIPTDLLALYDRLREQKGGVGAAELRRRECGGCRLALDNAELATIRAAGVEEVVRCEECSRILVRTAESGL